MGIFDCKDAEPLSWEETKKRSERFKELAIAHFINTYKNAEDRQEDAFKFGDETEYNLLHFDDDQRKVRLLLLGNKICDELHQRESKNPGSLAGEWQIEATDYMIESIPKHPFRGLAELGEVEGSLVLRRRELKQHLNGSQGTICCPAFPRLGTTKPFTLPEFKIIGPESNPFTESLVFPDEAISPHPVYRSLARNICDRSGKKVVSNVPIFRDENTLSPFVEVFSNDESNAAARPDHIYMDSTGFGMGFSHVQATMQAKSIEEAKLLFDQLGPLCPIVLALSAGSPIYRGYLSDIDVSWNVLTNTNDDRTEEEKSEHLKCSNGPEIPDPRWYSIRYYLTKEGQRYNDVPFKADAKVEKILHAEGVDEGISRYVAHTFIRDPIVMFPWQLDDDTKNDTSCSDLMFGMVFYTLRVKFPERGTPLGWRIEFRAAEVQPTDFENAAFIVFIVLLSRMILHFKLDVLMPISLIDANMEESFKNDSVRKSQFWFKQNIKSPNTPDSLFSDFERVCDEGKDGFVKMSINTIINGKVGKFPGFVPLIRRYLAEVGNAIPDTAKPTIEEYLSLISKKASGRYPITAHWIREYVRSHPEYKKDSVVSDSITYDLLKDWDRISNRLVDHHRRGFKSE